MFPEIILHSYLFGIGLTVIFYAFAEYLVNRLELNIIPPFVIACPLIIAVLVYAPDVSYDDYSRGADFINFLLGPSTIALALPLYRHRQIIGKNAAAILGSVTLASTVAIVTVYLCGTFMGASPKVLLSLMPKSVTVPIALDISKHIGGIPPLTAGAVIFTGMLGATFNHRLLKLCGIKSDLASGIAIGASSHGLGTSACARVSHVQLATAGVAIGLTGIATSILVPLLLPLLQKL